MRYSPAMSPMSGTGLCTATSSPRSGGLRVAAARQIVWAKQHFTLGAAIITGSTNLLVRRARGKASHWTGDRTQSTVWEIANNNPFGNPQREQSWGHGTRSQSSACAADRQQQPAGQAIYDPFLGSGTSLIAAEMTGRIATVSSSTPLMSTSSCDAGRASPGGRDASRLRSIVRGARPRPDHDQSGARTWQENHLP